MNGSTPIVKDAPTPNNGQACRRADSEAGFSLIEVAISMVVVLIALLGVAWTITYSINYNAGNSNRAKTLAVLQQEVERLRSAKFSPTFTDATLLGCDIDEPCSQSIVTSENLSFVITKTIDNDPSTGDIDDEMEVASADTRFKEIMVSATIAAPNPGWQTAVPAQVVLRRVKSN
jgi:prepilin-type N-terminal cleavage/methylation domain-containing protein